MQAAQFARTEMETSRGVHRALLVLGLLQKMGGFSKIRGGSIGRCWFSACFNRDTIFSSMVSPRRLHSAVLKCRSANLWSESDSGAAWGHRSW